MDPSFQNEYTPQRLVTALRQALAVCSECGLAPVLIGGMALDAYTASRATMDLDLLADFPPEAVGDITRRILAAGGRLDDEELATPQHEKRMIRFYLDGVQVDLLQAWDPEMKALLSRAEERRCLGMALHVPALIDFIVQKLRTGRPRDVDDAIRLLSVNRARVDLDRLQSEVRRLHLTEEWLLVKESVGL